jgi:hypothetical protein
MFWEGVYVFVLIGGIILGCEILINYCDDKGRIQFRKGVRK